MNKLDYNYHSHTYRCGHAVGEDEEYIKTAIKGGFKEYGVSDHVMLPNIVHHNMRGMYSELDNYIKSINNLKEKYKDKINIHLGFEIEYMPQYFDYYKNLLDTKKVEYLILGQHCYYENGTVRWYLTMEPKVGLKMYTDHLIEGIKSGLVKYVAHPDLFAIFYDEWDDLAIACSNRIIQASIKYNCPLEINLCKVRAYYGGYISNNYPHIYPFEPFWELVSKSKARIVIGIDTHVPNHNIDTGLNLVENLINKYKLKVEYNYRIDK